MQWCIETPLKTLENRSKKVMRERFRDLTGKPSQAYDDQLFQSSKQKAKSRWAGLPWPALTMNKSKDTGSSRVQIGRLRTDTQAYRDQLLPKAGLLWPALTMTKSKGTYPRTTPPRARHGGGFFVFWKSNFNALDSLYRPDRPKVVEAVSNNSFWKGYFLTKSVFAIPRCLENGLQNIFGMVSDQTDSKNNN